MAYAGEGSLERDDGLLPVGSSVGSKAGNCRCLGDHYRLWGTGYERSSRGSRGRPLEVNGAAAEPGMRTEHRTGAADNVLHGNC